MNDVKTLIGGWEPETLVDASIIRQFVCAYADRVSWMAGVTGGQVDRDPVACIADARSAFGYENAAVLLQPPGSIDLAGVLQRGSALFGPSRWWVLHHLGAPAATSRHRKARSMTEHEASRDALAERLVDACIAGFDLLNIYAGDELGLYAALAETDSMSISELADRCGIDQRYAREWLEQQSVAGILTIDETNPADRRFHLPPGHAEALTDSDSLAFMAPLAQGLVGVARALPRVLEAFRHGGGVEFSAYGGELRNFIARINRPMFLNQLAQEWFPQIDGLAARLSSNPPARVADIGCGSGWSSIAIARAYPLASVVGLDLDEGSIAQAHQNAAASGVADRVTFRLADAADPQLAGTFDLVCAFEAIHDMNDPIAALAAMRALRAPGGVALVADERVADGFTIDVDAGERFQWGWSALHCLPTAMTAPRAAGTGTIMRAPTFRRYAQAAGFADIEVLPIEHDFWRFYLLTD